MRLYSFVNFYLSPLQHGLQTAHCVSEFAHELNRYPTSRQYQSFLNWATNHKTIIICNGGNNQMLEDLSEKFSTLVKKLELPLTKFYEDEQSLNEALTAVAVIVPEWFYDVEFSPAAEGVEACYTHFEAKGFNGVTVYQNGTPEYEFIFLLKSFRLA